MRVVTVICLLAGLVLFGLVLYQGDLAEVWRQVQQIGWWGIALVLGISVLSFLPDVLSWQLTFTSVKLNLLWLTRLSLVHAVGEALNQVTPVVSFGGEPLKAILLNRHYGLGYRETTATLILAQLILVLSLILFLIVGLMLMAGADILPRSYQLAALVGFAMLFVFAVLFFVVQHFNLLSRSGSWFDRTWLGGRARRALEIVADIEGRLIAFYTRQRSRFTLALGFSFLTWVMDAVEIYVILLLLGQPVSFADAWLIQAAVTLVKTVLFMIPLGLGAQEGTFLIICTMITGSPTVGIAVALIRRFRELLWILLGLLLGWRFSVRRDAAAAARANR
ncbi:MAG: lysylphosphatidylglycerol synthase transmembrane domain-containing protein [Alphaproteobacteria bacterium]|nr:lysylphosphatidylglycerol synthase transmembrane domain-containing protein [Alphaproteobacteria bacterium]